MKFAHNAEMLNKLKLIIWDLDDTFWSGTISEGAVTKIQSNIDLVKILAKRGIISSICSKNDAQITKEELEKLQILDYFVFCSIDWSPKGARIKALIEEMNLRPGNVLFVDDNISNQKEAEFYSPELMVAGPEVLSEILKVVNTIGKDDTNLSRLKQYKVLEKKKEMSSYYNSNEEFLISSNIIVDIREPKDFEVDRITELVNRSNQLNFTKKRSSKQEIIELLQNKSVDCGCVYAKDDFGEYGLVGFFAIKNHQAIHFLFSCRTMGMGLEQYVYASIGYPELDIVEPVSGYVSKDASAPAYIHREAIQDKEIEQKNKVKVLIKGPCDLEVMASYLGKYEGLDKEFNFIDTAGMQADFYNHSINILNSLRLKKEVRSEIASKYPFISAEAYNTKFFTQEYDYIFISPLMDVTLGVYKNIKHGYCIPYGLYTKPITDRTNWNDYLSKKVMTARSSFLESQLRLFSEEFELIELSANDIAENYKLIIEKRMERFPNTVICIILLPELKYEASEKSDYMFKGKEKWHIAVNEEFRRIFSNKKNIILMDVNKYITSQNSYYDSINHYTKIVYYKMAQEFINILEENEGINIAIAPKSNVIKEQVYRIMQKVYHKYFKQDLFR